MPSGRITEHFSWQEMTTTENRDPVVLAAQGDPPEEIRQNVARFCAELLEPVRDLVGPLHVSSGYRSPVLNARVSGASKTSMHMQGCAADVHPLGMGLVEAFERISAASPEKLDQLIFEYGRWIHVGGTVPGKTPRGQRLMIFEAGKYEPWNPKDPRVAALREAP